ncbi:MAG: hypothetical protein M3Q68_05240 [Actinomycetota bacterium]|nr:hypothetical protein [Actinomycetota bacterium]
MAPRRITGRAAQGAVDRLEHLEVAATYTVQFHVWAPLQGARTDQEDRQVPAFMIVANRLGVTVRQVVLAWLRSVGPTSRRSSVP